ncbi:MAG TPA: MqnA/MqnD/SBP family protein [Planctomycetota bacterium]|nr:MqnA/MqnD/SBP family protein [Planctomycetota bacterium]
MSERLRVAISPCPNDTFAFAGLLERASDSGGLDLDFELHDVEQLNQRLARGELDAAKASFHAALRLSRETAVLSAGSALGFGVGPLLLARKHAPPLGPTARVLCPGEWTTASLLFQLFHGPAKVEQAVFSEIMPALEAGRADYGVCIHEGRFTWRERGLACVEDLGSSWEAAFGCALPLGGILFRKSRGAQLAQRLALAIEGSIAWARAHPERARAVMRRHAQELSDEVLAAHVDLYVNAQTLCLSHAARRALDTLSIQAKRLGLVDESAPALEIWGRREPLRLFHVLRREDADLLEGPAQSFRPASLASEGFVHLSFESQVDATLKAHFDPVDELVLLEIDADAAGAALRYETSRGGQLFPHLYRELRRSDVVARWTLEPAGAAWSSDSPPTRARARVDGD